MDVLIVEMDDLIAASLVEVLAYDDIMAEVVPGEKEAMAKCHDDCPKVVVTGINRQAEDMEGLRLGRAMRTRCPGIAVVYMAALWPVKLARNALDGRERFINKNKPPATENLAVTVR
jgi:DNA-binding NtrC family response regulator